MGTVAGILIVSLCLSGTVFGTKTKIAFLAERESEHEQREISLLPDSLSMDLTTDNGVLSLTLIRMRNIDHNSVDIEFDDPKIKKEHVDLNKMTVGYYQDAKHIAALNVEAKIEGLKIKRTLTGTLIYANKMHELRPALKELQEIDNILEDRGLGREHSHVVHVLEEVDDSFLNVDEKVTRLVPESIVSKKASEISESIVSKQASESLLLDRFLTLLQSLDEKKKREKRQTPSRIIHIELYFLVDYSIYKYYLNKYPSDPIPRLVYDFNHILNGMYLAYGSIEANTGIRIILWLKKMMILTDKNNEFVDNSFQVNKTEYRDADGVFKKLQSWSTSQGFTDNQYDHYMLWTKRNLYAGVDILGIAFKCAACLTQYAFSQNEFKGLSSWHTGAHELAHNLGSTHDTPGHCGDEGASKYIMYYQTFFLNLDVLNTAFTFSPCSVSDITECTNATGQYSTSYKKSCLFNTVCAHQKPLAGIDNLPGERLTPDDQCQIRYSSNGTSTSCSPINADICLSLKCRQKPGGPCLTSTLRGAPGTPCNPADPSMVCYFGKCVARSSIPSSTIDDTQCSTDGLPPRSLPPAPIPSPTTTPAPPTPSPITTSDPIPAPTPSPTITTSAPIPAPTPSPTTTSAASPAPTTGSTTSSASYGSPPQYCIISGRKTGVRCPSQLEKCILFADVCNEISDCPNNEDEHPNFCRQVPAPSRYFIRCSDDPSLNTHEYSYGTWLSNCSGFHESSEWYETAPRNCEWLGVQFGRGLNCPNKQDVCIPEYWACDGDDDCGASTGEIGDETLSFCQCGPGESLCKGQEHQCIKNSWVFSSNGKEQCTGGSDESLFYLDEWSQELPASTCKGNRIHCPSHPFLPCIKPNWICDLDDDCVDKSDEINCVKKKSNTKNTYESLFLRKIDKLLVRLEDEREAEVDEEILQFHSNFKKQKNDMKVAGLKEMTGKEKLRALADININKKAQRPIEQELTTRFATDTR